MKFPDLLQQLCTEYQLSLPTPDAEQKVSLAFNPELSILLRDLKPGVAMTATIAPCPPTKREELAIYLMRANFLGQGTGGARIGLDADEKFLTLSLGFSYEMNYQSFKESIEDFANYLIYWREELKKWT